MQGHRSAVIIIKCFQTQRLINFPNFQKLKSKMSQRILIIQFSKQTKQMKIRNTNPFFQTIQKHQQNYQALKDHQNSKNPSLDLLNRKNAKI